MDNVGEFNNYWETNMFYQTEELDSWVDEANYISGGGYYDDSSSPDSSCRAASSSPGGSAASAKNIVSERNRRKKLNERLFALRSVVPNITKMDKASIIKDAIEYIQHLHEQERRIQQEISEMESKSSDSSSSIMTLNPNYNNPTAAAALTASSSYCDFDSYSDYHHHHLPLSSYQMMRSKQKRSSDNNFSFGSTISPIQVLELRVTSMGERTLVVSLTCSKRTDTMVKICEVFESLKLNIITANVTAFSGRLLKTVFVEADEEEKEELEVRIKTAIAALNDPYSPMSM